MTIFNDDQVSASLETLVGEGKKYATPDDLAKAYAHADTYIENLKRENSEQREELQRRLTAEELIAKINAPPNVNTPAPERQEPAVQKTPLSEEDLVTRIREITNQDQKAKVLEANVAQVADKLIQTYGSEAKANEIVKARARELGVSLEFLQDVAAQSPKAFYAQLGLDLNAPPSTNNAPRSEVNPQALGNQNQSVKAGTYAYYEQIRKDNPKLYFTARVQNQLMKDAFAAEKRGENFYRSN